jgi:hypothetical protein
MQPSSSTSLLPFSSISSTLQEIDPSAEIVFQPGHKSNTSTQTFIKILTTKPRTRIQSHLESAIDSPLLPVPASQKHAIRFYDSSLEKNLLIYIKPQNKRSNPDPHEAMTACLLSKFRYSVPTSTSEADELLHSMTSPRVIKKISGLDPQVIPFFHSDYENLAMAISACESIKNSEHLTSAPSKIFLTGKHQTDPAIAHLFINPHPEMKNYNSSDIILFEKTNPLPLQISLKKATSSAKSPTLLNKSVQTFIDLPPEYTKKETRFFEQFTLTSPWQKTISQIDNAIINTSLRTTPDSHFTLIYNTLVNLPSRKIHGLLDMTLKTQLLKNPETSRFLLTTGIGSYGPQSAIRIQPGKSIPLSFFSALSSSELPLRIIPTSGLVQCFEPGSSASKLFLSIVISGSEQVPLLHLEIRYKGSFTTSPTILAFLPEKIQTII